MNEQERANGIYFNVNEIRKPSIAEVTTNEVQSNNFMTNLVMSAEEEASHLHGFDMAKVGEGNTVEQDMAIAHNIMHPNMMLQMQQRQQMAQTNNGFGTMNGYTQYGSFINPIASQQYAKMS